MSYLIVQAATKTILEGVTGYLDNTSVRLGDYGVLDDGLDHCAVLRPGAISGGETAARITDREYAVLVDIFRKWLNDNDTLQNLAVFRDAVFEQLDKYPTLNLSGTTRVLAITTDGDPVDVNDENGLGPFFVMQRLRIRVRRKIAQSGGEYA